MWKIRGRPSFGAGQLDIEQAAISGAQLKTVGHRRRLFVSAHGFWDSRVAAAGGRQDRAAGGGAGRADRARSRPGPPELIEELAGGPLSPLPAPLARRRRGRSRPRPSWPSRLWPRATARAPGAPWSPRRAACSAPTSRRGRAGDLRRRAIGGGRRLRAAGESQRAREEGFLVDGRWSFASGISHSDWMLGGCIVHGEDGPELLAGERPDVRLMAMAKSRTRGDRHLERLGPLRHGQPDVDAEEPAGSRRAGGLAVHRPPREQGAALRLPPVRAAGPGDLGRRPGDRPGAIDDLLALAAGKRPAPGARSLAERSTVQAELARAEASLRAARALALEQISAGLGCSREGRGPPDELKLGLRLAATHATETAAEVATAMYRAGRRELDLFGQSPPAALPRRQRGNTAHDGRPGHLGADGAPPVRPADRHLSALVPRATATGALARVWRDELSEKDLPRRAAACRPRPRPGAGGLRVLSPHPATASNRSPPREILEATKTAASEAKSVHISGSIISEGKPITLDMELLAGKGGKGKIGQEGFTIYADPDRRLRLHQRQRRLLQARRRRRRGPAAAGTLAEGARQQRRTGLAGLPDEPQQADRQRPGQPRDARPRARPRRSTARRRSH